MTCEQLSDLCGLSMNELSELVGYSALIPALGDAVHLDAPSKQRWVFSTHCLKPLREACQLRNDFDLDLFTVAVVLSKLQRIDELENITQAMQRQISCMRQLAADLVPNFEQVLSEAECQRIDSAQIERLGKK